MTNQPVKHMTIAEVAERLRITPRTLETMRKNGTGPKAMKMGPRIVRYSEDDVLAYEAECRKVR